MKKRTSYHYVVTSDTGRDTRFPNPNRINPPFTQERACEDAILDAQERMRLGQKNVSVQLFETFTEETVEYTYIDVPPVKRIWVGKNTRYPNAADIILENEESYKMWVQLKNTIGQSIKWYTGVVELTEVSS
jgi:hypothetical protein